MERDFFGVRKDDEFRPKGQDGGAFSGSAMQRPFSNKNTIMQQYMSFKAAQEESQRQKKFAAVEQQFSSSGFQPMPAVDALEAIQRTPAAVSSKKFDRQVIHQFPMQPYKIPGVETTINSSRQLNENRSFPMISHHSVPVATSSPFFQVHGAQNSPNNIAVSSLNQLPYGANTGALGVGSATGTFPPRNMRKRTPISAQMTIFYAGTVNVYDDVPFEKAHAIMLLASKGSNSGPDSVKQRSELPQQASVPVTTIPTPVSTPAMASPMYQTTVQGSVLQAQVPVMNKLSATNGLNSKISIPAPIRVPSPCSAVSSPISVTSRLGASSGCVSSTTDDTAVRKLVSPLTSASPQETSRITNIASGSTMPEELTPRAVPQARKASLARFLEKRKERVTSVAPYTCMKSSVVESGVRFDSTNSITISSSTDFNVSSNGSDSWCLGQSKGSLSNGESPSTKLKM